MLQLVLESENEKNIKLMQELAEKLNIHCQLFFQKAAIESIKQKETRHTIKLKEKKTAQMKCFLDNLSDKPEKAGLTREQINQYLQFERESWDG